MATALFILQVGIHVATPDGMTLPAVLDTVMNGAMAMEMGPAPTSGLSYQPDQAAFSQDAPRQTGEQPGPGHHSHAEGLCCTPPMALAPEFWMVPVVSASRQPLTPAKAVSEALRVLRATARGPPLERTIGVRPV